MLDSLEAGDELPGQPPGPFGPSDTMTMREFLYSPGQLPKPFVQCLRHVVVHPPTHDPSLGWTQAGEWQCSLDPDAISILSFPAEVVAVFWFLLTDCYPHYREGREYWGLLRRDEVCHGPSDHEGHTSSSGSRRVRSFRGVVNKIQDYEGKKLFI